MTLLMGHEEQSPFELSISPFYYTAESNEAHLHSVDLDSWKRALKTRKRIGKRAPCNAFNAWIFWERDPVEIQEFVWWRRNQLRAKSLSSGDGIIIGGRTCKSEEKCELRAPASGERVKICAVTIKTSRSTVKKACADPPAPRN